VSERHVFDDEWLLRSARTLPGVAALVEPLRLQRRKRLFDALLEAGAATERELRDAVLLTHDVRALPSGAAAENPAVALLNERICRRFRIAPLRLNGDRIEIAMENPLDLTAMGDVQAMTGRAPDAFHALPGQIDVLIASAYSTEHVVDDLVERLDVAAPAEVLRDEDSPPSQDPDDVRAPVVRLVGSILAKAFHMKASDVHLEHDERASFVRFRVDGALRNIVTLPLAVGAGPVVARIKIMADLDIADRLRPQDGRAKLRVGGVEVGLRVSTLPTNYGEKVVIRLLDKRSAEVPLEKLGMRPEIVALIDRMIQRTQGALLVTGPTGSGKTTTLYSILNRRKAERTNIVTVEDPIEYKLEGINQVQVNEKQGLTFAAVLRSVLRQDPNVILVGEIRDRETADTAIAAAQTGHMVLSTLHTNDALSTISRLADIGLERYKLAAGLNAITAQRLVRSLCAACRAPAAEVDPALAAAQRARGLEPRQFEPRGCAACALSGYKGRTSLVEFLEVTDGVRQRIAAGEGEAALREFALSEKSLSTMLDDAVWHVAHGDTTLDEIRSYVPLPAAASAPAAAEPAARRREPAAPAPRPTAETAPRVLIVDDDPTIRIILRKILENQGCRVEETADGAEALAVIAGQTPDMIIVDLNMPGLDGYGVIRGVRDSLGLADVPVLILTSDPDEESQVEALELGADDYILKPVRPSIVSARVKAAFRRSAA
jgi:type IV pilus assembly protein PilB